MKSLLKLLAGTSAIALASVASAQTYIAAGNITTNQTWSGTIVLEGLVFVTNGATLTISPGTIIRGQPRSSAETFDPGTLIITPGAKINANGQANNPIIFTSAAIDADSNGSPDGTAPFYTRASGVNPAFWDATPATSPRSANTVNTWGGLIILGNAPTNADQNPATVAVDQTTIEGLPPAPLGTFGGSLPNDNSGVLRYVSVRHGGSNLSDNNEINGVTLGGVGRGTQIEFIEIFGNEDDGLEIFGGTVNVRNVVVIAPSDDGLDFDLGWTGTIQNALVIGGNRTDTLCEWDGDYTTDRDSSGVTTATAGNVAPNRMPLSAWAAANLTLVGFKTSTSANNGIRIRDAAAPMLFNSIVYNAKGYSVRFDAHNYTGTTGQTADGVTDTISRWNSGVLRIAGLTAFNNGSAYSNGNHLSGPATNVASPAVFSGSNVSVLNPGFIPVSYVNNSASALHQLPQGFNPVPFRSGQSGNPGAYANVQTVPANLGLATATARGAFPTANNASLWTTGWTAANISGILVSTSGL